MARKGRAGFALGISAMGAAIGSVMGALALLVFIPVAKTVIMSFGAPELFWLIVLGIVSISASSPGRLLSGLAAGCCGLLVALIGYSPAFGVERFTMGSLYLWDGVQLLPFFLGLFSVSEMITFIVRGGAVAETPMIGTTMNWGWWLRQGLEGARFCLSRTVDWLRSSAVGTIVGIIPGLGATVAAPLSYVIFGQSRKHRDSLGTGIPEGIIATEVASNAKEGGASIVTFGFGIPGSADHAILLAALIMVGLKPGPSLVRDTPEVLYFVVFAIVAAQLVTSGVGLFIGTSVARLSKISMRNIAPFVILLVFIGVYAVRGNIFDVVQTIVFGVIGYGIKRVGFPILPIVIGYVLGDKAELYYTQALASNWGSHTIFLASPVSITLASLALLALSFSLIQSKRRK